VASLRLGLALAVLLWSAEVAADPLDRWTGEIAAASSRFAIPREWIRRVMRVESGGRTVLGGQPIVSAAGAMGLMQLMPRTWGEMRLALRLGPNPNDPHDNIAAGAAYLRLLYERFGYPGLFAAYNAGPERYADYLSGRRALPAETRAYVAAVVAAKPGRSALAVEARPAIFAIEKGRTPAPPAAESLRPGSAGLFVTLAGTGHQPLGGSSPAGGEGAKRLPKETEE
jgi:soluble lytic murein transglycosylase-like protein